MGQKGRQGTPPKDQKDVAPAGPPPNPGFPNLGFRFLEEGWGIEPLSPKQAKDFVLKWERRGKFTWDELRMHSRHGLGAEKIPTSAIRPQLPRWMDKNQALLVFRHEGNLAQVGIRIGNTFEVVWIEAKYNDLYSHDDKNRR